MFTGKQFGILGVVSGANLLLSLLVSTVGGSLGAQGPTGQTGPQGPQGSTGEAGTTGADGREVEFDVENNVLVWRYVGDAEWQELDLEISGGGGGTINTGGNGLYSHWIFSVNPTLRFDYRSRISVDVSATYAANLIANEGFVGVSTLADLEAIDDTPESLAGKYVLTSNIDLTAWTPNTNDNIYNVITGNFTGIFDGAGYGITNMTIDTTVANVTINRGGLFNTLDGAIIQNLNLGNFTFISPQQILSTGALAGNINNELVLIDQVYADNILLKATAQVYESGGLVGYVNGHIDFIRTVVANTEFQSDGSFYAAGGLYGWVDGYDVGLYEISSQLTINPITQGIQVDADRVGGTGGSHQNNANLIGSKITTSLTGAVDSHSAGFVGNMAGLSKVILQDLTINANLTQLYTNGGYNNGGVFGFYGRDGMLIMDDILVNGVIQGNNDIGGFIGHSKEGSVIRISNSTSNADIAGDEYIGGAIGRLEGNEHKTVIDGVTINSDLTLIEQMGNTGQNGNSFGGLIGYIDERDDSDVIFTNQTFIQDTDVTVDFKYQIGDLTNIEGRYVGFESFGGMVGMLDYDNDLRVANSTVDVNITYDQTLSTKVENFSFNMNEIGGIVGLADESNVLVINTLADVDMNVTSENFNPEAGYETSFGFYLYRVGGIAGELDDKTQLTIVSSVGDLTINMLQADFNSTFLDFNYSVIDTGGIVGDLNSDAMVLGESVTGNYALTFTIDNLPVADGNTMNILIEQNAGLIGQADGVAILSDVEYATSLSLSLPEAVENKIYLDVTTTTNPIGNVNPFVFISE